MTAPRFNIRPSPSIQYKTTDAGQELLLCVSEMKILQLKASLLSTSASILDKMNNSTLSDEKKEPNYRLCELLIDANKMIDKLVEQDIKRMGRNFDYIIRIQKLEKELAELTIENENLKQRIPK